MAKLQVVECIDANKRLFRMPNKRMGIIIDARDNTVSSSDAVENYIDGIFQLRSDVPLPIRMIV